MLSLSILGVGTLEGGLLANFKSTLVRPQESIAETQPQLHPILPTLSPIISEYFTRRNHAVFNLHTNENVI
jgi:hypothetical protein